MGHHGMNNGLGEQALDDILASRLNILLVFTMRSKNFPGKKALFKRLIFTPPGFSNVDLTKIAYHAISCAKCVDMTGRVARGGYLTSVEFPGFLPGRRHLQVLYLPDTIVWQQHGEIKKVNRCPYHRLSHEVAKQLKTFG